MPFFMNYVRAIVNKILPFLFALLNAIFRVSSDFRVPFLQYCKLRMYNSVSSMTCIEFVEMKVLKNFYQQVGQEQQGF